MDVDKVEATLGRLEDQYEYEGEANDQCDVHDDGYCMQYLVSFCHTWLCKHTFFNNKCVLEFCPWLEPMIMFHTY